MKPIFVDTSAFVALVDRDDGNHGSAKRFLRALSKAKRPLVTSTYVLDESFTLIRMRVSHPAAVGFGESISKSAWCRAIDVLEDTRDAAWEIFVRYEDQLFSFTDCTSFALMHSMKLEEAFTYDKKDFGAAGFTPVPA